MYRLRAFFFGVNFRSLPPATVTRLRQLGLKLSPPPALSRVAQDSDAKGFAEGASDELANSDFLDRSHGAELFAHAQRSFDGKNRRKSTVPLIVWFTQARHGASDFYMSANSTSVARFTR